MQDRFKFRAWFKPEYREPIMLYDVEQTYDFMRGEPENVPEDCFGDVLADDDYIVMQCTGLKDKSGKLIYESDIVKIDFVNILDKILFTEIKPIKWDKRGMFLCGDYPIPYDKKFVEVIGNIYENKELLND